MRIPAIAKAALVLGAFCLLPTIVAADALVQIGTTSVGADANGHVQLHAPTPVELGSSTSHWNGETAGVPLLMHPSLSNVLGFMQTDLTPSLFHDLGYQPGAALFDLVVLDGPNEGFNDPEPVDPIGSNTGTTLGAQRLQAIQFVLAKWAEVMEISTPVRVGIYTEDLFCDEEEGAVLASAGAYCVLIDDETDTVYPGALAKALAGPYGDECDPDNPGPDYDLIVRLNENIDDGCLGAGTAYYYGNDGNAPTNLLDVSNTLLHEVAHGLGFQSFVDKQTGQHSFSPNVGIYDRFVYDNETQEPWDEMSNTERKASVTNGPNVVWTGDQVTGASANWAVGLQLAINFPEGQAPLEAGFAEFGAPVFGADAVHPSGLAAVASPGLACEAVTGVDGKFALIERGDCTFVVKAANAQAAGAIGVIIYNSSSATLPNDIFYPAGVAPDVTIPVVTLGRNDGLALKNLIENGPALACVPTSANACLLSGRFQVNVAYTTESSAGIGQVMSFDGARAESDQSAFFYFFDNANFEMGVKMVDACSFNDSFWVFVSGLTNQAYAVTIIDIFTGQTRVYTNPLGTYPQTIGATDGVGGFDCTPDEGVRFEQPTPAQVRAVLASGPIDPLGDSLVGELAPTAENTAACVADADTACHLGGRFQVEVDWTTVSDTGAAQVMSFGGQRASSDQSSFWWFFDPANFEMGVKMVDACVPPFNAYWVFVSGLTNQAFTVNVTDTTTLQSKPYSNPLGVYPQTIGATGSNDGFPCTP